MTKFSKAFVASPWTYFGATFLWTWSLCAVLIFTDLPSNQGVAFATLLLAIFGPGVTGILFTYWTRSESEIRDYWHRVTDLRRVTLPWLVIALGLPFILQLTAGAFDGLAGGDGLRWGEAAPAFIRNPATQLLSVFVVTLIPFFEELGWRGYAQDALERKRSALGASMVVGFAWSLWHLPASFIPGTYQAGLGVGTLEFWLHFVGIVVLSVVVSWIYVNTNRSILIMVVFHATVNLSGELIQLSEMGEVIYTLCWVSAAAAIALGFGRTMRVDSVLGRPGVVGGGLLVAAVLVASVASCGVTPRSAESCDLTDRFRAELGALRLEYGFPGATAAYILADGTVGHVATGMADVEAGQVMTPNSTMPAASVGKMFVSATVLGLAEEGTVGLDDPIATWLSDRPWFHRIANHDRITLRHLLNHTAGVPNHVDTEAFAQAFAARWPETEKAMAPEELIALILDRPPVFAPGNGWMYSDTGYLLVGLIIEKATGRSYYEEVSRRFIEPFGLNATSPSDRIKLPGLAAGYLEVDNRFGLPPRTTDGSGSMVWNPGVEWTGGGLLSNPQDLVRWARVLFEGKALGGEYLGELLTSYPLEEAGGLGYGLGVAVHEGGTHGTTLGHGGWIPGYCTSLRYYPDLGIGVSFQLNTDVGVMDGTPSAIDEIERRLAGVVAEAAQHAGS